MQDQYTGQSGRFITNPGIGAHDGYGGEPGTYLLKDGQRIPADPAASKPSAAAAPAAKAPSKPAPARKAASAANKTE